MQEMQQQEEAAAAAAGQPIGCASQQAEIFHLQHVLLARRAAVFLRLDSLEECALGCGECQCGPLREPLTETQSCRMGFHR